MITTAPTYSDFVADVLEIADRLRDLISELRFELSGCPRMLRLRTYRRFVYKYATQMVWFESPSLVDLALTYCDRYAVEDAQSLRFIRPYCAHDPSEANRALLIACIYYHATHPKTLELA